MEKILKKTYGILVYQDDLLMIAREIAGYSWAEADKFRKAMGKKIPEEMMKQKEHFIKGCVETSKWNWQKANELWTWIEPFAAYGFGKAHAASYGNVSYLTAYMKANYPAEYMTAVLTAESGDIEKVTEMIEECKRMGFVILPPDVNESFSDFTIVKDKNNNITKPPSPPATASQGKIRFGLRSIKNFGEEIGKAIIWERKKAGPFSSIADFLARINHKNLNKKSLEALIMSGAMDCFSERGELLANTEDMLNFNKDINKLDTSQNSLFTGMDLSMPTFKLKPADKVSDETKLKWEKELLGLYITGHPLDKWKKMLEKSNMNIKKIKEMFSNGMEVSFLGIVEEIKTILTKNNEQMAFVKISDLTGMIETVFFPKNFKDLKNILAENKCLIITGRISNRDDKKSLIVEKVKEC